MATKPNYPGVAVYRQYVYDPNTLCWVCAKQASGGGGGVASSVSVSNFPATQPVSIATLPTLPSGTNVIGHVIVDSAPTTAVTNAGLSNIDVALSTRLKPTDTLTKVTTVDTITNPVAVTGTFWQSTQPVSAATLPLPTGAATGAKQDSSNTSLASIDGKVPALGQALAAGSVPVILPSATISTLTPPANTGYALDATLSTIDTDIKSNITLHAGTNLVGKVGLDQTTDGTTNKVYVGNVAHVIVDTAPSTAVTGPITDTQLRATAVPVSLSTLPSLVAGSAVIGHVIVDSQPAVTNDATFAKETGGNLDSIKADLDKLPLAQGVTSSGAAGVLVQGVVNDTEDCVVPDTIRPLNIGTDGRLRVITYSESTNFTPWGSPEAWGSDGQDTTTYLSAW